MGSARKQSNEKNRKSITSLFSGGGGSHRKGFGISLDSGESKRAYDSEEEEENVSENAMVAVEAIYKFIRRNNRLLHIDLSRT